MITVSTVMVSAPASNTMSWPAIRREAKLVPGRTVRTDELGAVTSSALPHPVSDTAHCGHKPCRLSRLVELSSEVGDVHINEMVISDPAVAPDGFHQLAAAESLARPVRQGHQEPPLGGGQRDHPASESYFLGSSVDLKLAERTHHA